MKYIDADLLRKEIEYLKAVHIGHAAITKETNAVDGLDAALQVIDSLQQEPIEKDEKMEALIACDIMEATVKRVNIDKQDKDKEEEAMLEKINYLRNLGLNAKEK